MSKRKTSSDGILFVVSAPSGAGKTTLVEKVLRSDRKLYRTISHTTRLPRPGEKNRKDYFFVDRFQFEHLIRDGSILEWATVYGELYGTSNWQVREGLKHGRDVVLAIEANGAKAIRRKFKNAVFVLILPPSMAELRKRIQKRPGSTRESVQKRLREARKEIQAMGWYDYVLINDRLDHAVSGLKSIIEAERNRVQRRNKLILSMI